MPLLRVAGLAHLYVCYGMIWYASGWWAVVRTLRGRTGWAKTDRVAEAPVILAQPVRVAASASMVPAGLVALAADPPVSPEKPAVRLAEAPTLPMPPIPVLSVPVLSGPVPSGPVPSGPGCPGRRGPWPARRDRGPRGTAAQGEGSGGGRRPGLRDGRGRVVARSVITGHEPGRSPWRTVFNGYGHTDVTGSGVTQAITTAPRRASSRRATHAALVISRGHYADFVATLRVQTIRQLRRGAAGSPHPWEVGWVVWHYTSDQNFYALTLEPTGWLLSKQDPAYPGGERFLASGRTPRFRLGVTHRVGIVQTGDQVTVSGDGQLLARFTDTQRPYLRGAFGLYSEDSDAQFSDIRVSPLPGPARQASRAPVPGHRVSHVPALIPPDRRGNSHPGRNRPIRCHSPRVASAPGSPPAGAGRQIMVIYGTRPEAVKVAPLIQALDRSEVFTPVVAVTAQHRSMLDQVNAVFDVKPAFDLDIHRPGQTLTEITTRALSGVRSVLAQQRPDAVVVQGDTTTVFAAALAAFYEQIPVVHLEAGLRTGDPYSPYPEEINRRLTTRLAALHLAPTSTSKANLLTENVDDGQHRGDREHGHRRPAVGRPAPAPATANRRWPAWMTTTRRCCWSPRTGGNRGVTRCARSAARWPASRPRTATCASCSPCTATRWSGTRYCPPCAAFLTSS